MNEKRLGLVKAALEILIKEAESLSDILENGVDEPEGEDDDPLTESEAFENLHDAMQLYAEQFTAYEGAARNGYGTITVAVTKEA